MDELVTYLNKDTRVLYVSKGHHFMYVTAEELNGDKKPKMPLGLLNSLTDSEAKTVLDLSISLKETVNKPSLGTATALGFSALSLKLPGVNETVKYPCKCGVAGRLWDVIQHLNDKHNEWTRERIADWVESLDVDTEFKNAVG